MQGIGIILNDIVSKVRGARYSSKVVVISIATGIGEELQFPGIKECNCIDYLPDRIATHLAQVPFTRIFIGIEKQGELGCCTKIIGYVILSTNWC